MFSGKDAYLIEEYFSVERRRVLPQRMVPHASAEDEVERVVGSLELRGHVQDVLVSRERHGQRVTRYDAVQGELGALALTRHADLTIIEQIMRIMLLGDYWMERSRVERKKSV